jgi:hypothetical protein
MSYGISSSARQRLRLQMQNVESADEIVDSLNEFLNRFILISGTFTSTQWSTIYEYVPENNTTVMLTYSIIAKQSVNSQAGFKRTAVFYKDSNSVSSINLSQSDFTSKTDDGFNARLIANGDKILLQVKGATSNSTKWNGSIEVEKLKD